MTTPIVTELSRQLEPTTPDSTTPDSTTPDSTTPDSTTPDSTTPDSTTTDSTTTDSLIEDLSGRAARHGVIRELDRRRSDGIEVRLLWSQTDAQVLVAVADAKTGDTFAISVEPHEAAIAFRHPYSYAASQRPITYELAV
jgi:hypothetical protein